LFSVLSIGVATVERKPEQSVTVTVNDKSTAAWASDERQKICCQLNVKNSSRCQGKYYLYILSECQSTDENSERAVVVARPKGRTNGHKFANGEVAEIYA